MRDLLFSLDNRLHSLSSEKGRVLRAVETVEEIVRQMGRPKKVPYYQVVLVVLEVVDVMLSSSTIRDFHKNSF